LLGSCAALYPPPLAISACCLLLAGLLAALGAVADSQFRGGSGLFYVSAVLKTARGASCASAARPRRPGAGRLKYADIDNAVKRIKLKLAPDVETEFVDRTAPLGR
jgi:hypothetical protein